MDASMTTPTPDDAVRRQFEAWAVEHGLPTERDSAGGYTDDEAQTAWSAVQYVHALEAALSAQPAIGAAGTGPLSERLRAGIECAPWVLAAVQKLEAQIAAQPAERQGEVWLPVLGVDGFEASNTGQVRNTHTGKTLSQSSSGAGYLKVQFSKDGERIQRNVHRVIAEAFLGLREGMQVNHIDGDKTNNALTNLEWVTKSQNEQHSRYALGNLCSPVFATHNESGETREFASQALAERELGLPRDAVRRCLTGATKSSMGWVFSTHPAAPVGVPDGVLLLDFAVNHAEKAVGNRGVVFELRFDPLPFRDGNLRDYLLAAAPSAPQGVDRG